MKHLMKVSLMALVAMFAFNTTADAQLGGLLKKAKAAVSGKSSQNNAGQAIYDQMKAREAAEAAKMEEIQKQAVISPYNASAELKEGMVRTIFTVGGQKMMLDQHPGFCKQYGKKDKMYVLEDADADKLLKSKWKDEAFMKRALEDFADKHEDRTAYSLLNYEGPAKKWKAVNIGTKATGWQYNRNKWGDITYRYFRVYILFELEDGHNVIAPFEVCENEAGGGNYYEDTLLWAKTAWTESSRDESGFFLKEINGWEVKTDCYTSTMANK